MKQIKLLVVSDSHGNNSNIQRAIDMESPFDILVHCGDVEGSRSTIAPKEPPYEVIVVRGNCDYGNSLPLEREFKAGFFNVWVTHGDKYNVKYDEKLVNLKQVAGGKSADIVLFGHSHYAEIVKDTETGMILVNPGSIGDPKISSGRPTYAVIVITEDYDVIPVIKQLDE
jgi:putative phosphoesterase